MQAQRFAIIDPAAGISGDMLLGALVAAGAPVAWLTGLPARLGLDGVTVRVRDVVRGGVSAIKVDVEIRGEVEGPNGQVSPAVGAPHAHAHEHGDHAHAHSHGHSHADHSHVPGHAHGHAATSHHHVRDLVTIIERAPLSDWVASRAVRALRLIAEAEGRIHGVAADDVALHEVGAMDAIVDLVGGIEGFEQLGLTTIYARPLALGEGWVRCAHGTMPVPAPATAMLVASLEIGPNGPVTGEATTPTGAALLRVLSAGPPPGRWRAVAASAWGAGTRDPHGYANALRLMVAEPVREATDVVTVACDLDDLSPEYLEPLREALVEAGALDVQCWATQMKKGRTGFRIEAVAAVEAADAVSTAMLRHSTTAGVRRTSGERVTLARHEVSVEVAPGEHVRVKLLAAPDGTRAKPEFEDVAAVARRLGQPAHDVARRSQVLAMQLVEQTP